MNETRSTTLAQRNRFGASVTLGACLFVSVAMFASPQQSQAQTCALEPPGVCAARQAIDCTTGAAGETCVPLTLSRDGSFNIIFVDQCTCADPLNTCSAINITGTGSSTAFRCGSPTCDTSPDPCNVFVSGVSTGSNGILITDFAIDDMITCGCDPDVGVCPPPPAPLLDLCVTPGLLADCDTPGGTACVPQSVFVAGGGLNAANQCMCDGPDVGCGPVLVTPLPSATPPDTSFRCSSTCSGTVDPCRIHIDGVAVLPLTTSILESVVVSDGTAHTVTCGCPQVTVPCDQSDPATCNGACPALTHCESVPAAIVLLPSPNLPPESDPSDCETLKSRYGGRGQQALFPNGLQLSEVVHRCFRNVERRTEPTSGDETQTFLMVMEGAFDNGNGPQLFVASGPAQLVARGKGGATTGSWDTEIVSMSLSGDVGGVSIEIRESPGLPSPGHTTIATLGGDYQIDSFFDVFVELSVDGGPFQPQTNGAGRMELEPIRSAILPSPGLPAGSDAPECGDKVSDFPWLPPVQFPGIVLDGLTFECPKIVLRQDNGSDEVDDLDLTLRGTYDDGSGPQPFVLTGPVQQIVKGKSKHDTTGSWQTEILSMDLSGDVGGVSIDIRQSPSLPSPGQTDVTSLGGGQWQIDSFFDVFVELSVDGGPFQPQLSDPSRVNLQPLHDTKCDCIPDPIPCEQSAYPDCLGDCTDATLSCLPDVCSSDLHNLLDKS